MLTELHIQNIAVIQEATIPFEPGLNVFTGETGAGKTILITALDAVLGERTSRDIIRTGEETAVVSALFENVSPAALEALENLGFEAPDGSVLIFREMTASGRNVCRVNGRPANVTMLKEISQHLIHIHGQRDTGQLLSGDYHLQMIDEFGELEPDIERYQQSYQALVEKQSKLASLNVDEQQKQQRLDMLNFQIQDIESAHIKGPGEEDDLLAQKKIVAGGERIRQGLSAAYGSFEGDGDVPGIEGLLDIFSTSLQQAATHMETLEPLVSRLEDARYEITDIAHEVQYALEELDFDPQVLDSIELRLDVLYNLKRKYGASIPEVLDHYNATKEELESITMGDQKKEELEEEVAELKKECFELAQALSVKRGDACQRFTQLVESELQFLDMPSVELSAAHTVTPLGPIGHDEIEFLIVTNVGEEPRPLGKIASGGELARLMLAIKNVMAHRDDIDTLIFDEIDTGVSGLAAGKIGRKLAEVADTRQVLVVTHLAQVAAYARHHLYIYKTTQEGRTYTLVEGLDHESRIRELARITSGEVITPAALESAREMVRRAETHQNE